MLLVRNSADPWSCVRDLLERGRLPPPTLLRLGAKPRWRSHLWEELPCVWGELAFERVSKVQRGAVCANLGELGAIGPLWAELGLLKTSGAFLPGIDS